MSSSTPVFPRSLIVTPKRIRRGGFQRVSYLVRTRSLADICAEYVVGQIHFLKIDAEGAELETLAGCDFTRYRPWIVLIEAFEPLSRTPSYLDLRSHPDRAGYQFAA